MRWGDGYRSGESNLEDDSFVRLILVSEQPTNTIIKGTITSHMKPALSLLYKWKRLVSNAPMFSLSVLG